MYIDTLIGMWRVRPRVLIPAAFVTFIVVMLLMVQFYERIDEHQGSVTSGGILLGMIGRADVTDVAQRRVSDAQEEPRRIETILDLLTEHQASDWWASKSAKSSPDRSVHYRVLVTVVPMRVRSH